MTGVPDLGSSRSPDLDGRAVTVLVPLGATEQHGPHLPLDTDTRIATAIATRARDRTGSADVLVAPAIPYGASGEHEGFAGTISIGHEALHHLLVEYGRSGCRWAHRVLFVNAHGGNGITVRSAVRQLRHEGRDAAWFPCAFPDADAHAGATETSVLLYLAPDVVDVARATVGNRRPVEALLGPMRAGGVAAVSRNGILGDPTAADAATGERLVHEAATGLVAALARWRVDDGRLR